MEIRSNARTENSHKHEKKYFEILVDYAKNQLRQLDGIKNEFTKEEIKNICHYIMSKMDLLLLNIEIMYVIISKLQQIASQFAAEINIDHFAQVNTIPISKEMQFTANFNNDCYLLRLTTTNNSGLKIRKDKSAHLFQSQSHSIQYAILTDVELQKQFDFLQVNIQNNFNFTYDVKYNANQLQLQLQQQRSGKPSSQQKIIESEISQLKKSNYQLHFSRIMSQNANEIDSYILQANISQNSFRTPSQQNQQKAAQQQYPSQQRNQTQQYNKYPISNQTNLQNKQTNVLQNQKQPQNTFTFQNPKSNQNQFQQQENLDVNQSLEGKSYLLPVSKVWSYTNAFGEEYYVQLREQEEYSLKEVLNEFESKQLRYSEQEMIVILGNIFEAIQYFHSIGYIIGSFSPSEIVFHENRWKFKQVSQMQAINSTGSSSSKISNGQYSVRGYFELMSPQLQQLVKMNANIGNYNGQAADYYNLGTIINGLSSTKQQYTPYFNTIIKQLTDYDSLARMDTQNIRYLLQPYKFCIRQGLEISKSKNLKTNFKKLYQSFMSLGSKSLAISSVNAAHPKEDYHCQIEKGYLLQVFQEYADAITYYRKAEQNAIANNKPYNIIPINNNIGQILQRNSKYDQALQSFKKAVDTSLQLCSQNSLEYVKSLENLSTAQTDLQKYKEAEKGFEEVLNLKKRLIRNQNDMQFSITYNNLGFVQEKLDKKLQAIGNFRKSLDIMEYNLGSTNPDIAGLHDKIGDLFLQLPGRQDDALGHFQQSHRIYSLLKDSVQTHKLSEKIKRTTPNQQKISQK